MKAVHTVEHPTFKGRDRTPKCTITNAPRKASTSIPSAARPAIARKAKAVAEAAAIATTVHPATTNARNERPQEETAVAICFSLQSCRG